MSDEPIFIHTFHYFEVSSQRKEDNEDMARLNYMASRIRAALFRWSIAYTKEHAAQWWWTGLRNEMDAAMAIVGHAAASMNIFLDIPILLRGLSQSMRHECGPQIQLSKQMWEEIERMPDPEDPTEMVDNYYHDWWNHDTAWLDNPQVAVDQEKAFTWHVQKYGRIRGNKAQHPFTNSSPPLETTRLNPCKSRVCRDRLHSVLGEVKKANQVVRSLMTDMQEDRVKATRHIQHLKALKVYQHTNRKTSLTLTDVENLLHSAGGKDAILEVVSDDEVLCSAGPSSGNRSLTPQSLSMRGYSDSDSDYQP